MCCRRSGLSRVSTSVIDKACRIGGYERRTVSRQAPLVRNSMKNRFRDWRGLSRKSDARSNK